MKKAYDAVQQIATFTFDGLEPLTFNVSKMSAENEAAMLGHGVLARLGDMAAIPRKGPNGEVITVTEAMRREAIEAGIAHYESGTTDWNMKGGDRAPKQNPTILAIAAKLGVSYAEAEAEVARRMLADAPQ